MFLQYVAHGGPFFFSNSTILLWNQQNITSSLFCFPGQVTFQLNDFKHVCMPQHINVDVLRAPRGQRTSTDIH